MLWTNSPESVYYDFLLQKPGHFVVRRYNGRNGLKMSPLQLFSSLCSVASDSRSNINQSDLTQLDPQINWKHNLQRLHRLNLGFWAACTFEMQRICLASVLKMKLHPSSAEYLNCLSHWSCCYQSLSKCFSLSVLLQEKECWRLYCHKGFKPLYLSEIGVYLK